MSMRLRLRPICPAGMAICFLPNITDGFPCIPPTRKCFPYTPLPLFYVIPQRPCLPPRPIFPLILLACRYVPGIPLTEGAEGKAELKRVFQLKRLKLPSVLNLVTQAHARQEKGMLMVHLKEAGKHRPR